MEDEPEYRSIELTSFPDLPETDTWSNNVIRAYDLIQKSYGLAVRLLRQDDCSALQLRMLSYRLREDTYPLMATLSEEIGDEEWTEQSVLLLGAAIVQLRLAGEQKRGSECVFLYLTRITTDMR